MELSPSSGESNAGTDLQPLIWVVIPILSVYLGFEAYSWWTVLTIGAGGFLNYAMVNPKAVAGAFDERGVGYLAPAVVVNSIVPAILFARAIAESW